MKRRAKIAIDKDDFFYRSDSDYEADKVATLDMRNDRLKWYDMAMNNPEADEPEENAQRKDYNFSMPLTSMALNQYHTRIVGGIYSQKPFVQFIPTEKHDLELVKKNEEFMNFLLFNHVKDFFKTLDEGIYIALMEGQWFNCKQWVRDVRTIKTYYGPYPAINPQTGQMVTAEEIIENIFGGGHSRIVTNIEPLGDDQFKVEYKQRRVYKPGEDEWEDETGWIDLALEGLPEEYYDTPEAMQKASISAVVESKEVIFEGVKIDNQNFDYTFFPPDVKSLQPGDCPHVIIDFDMTISELKSKVKEKIFECSDEDMKEIERHLHERTRFSEKHDDVSQKAKEKAGINSHFTQERKWVYLKNCFYSMDINDDGINEEVVIVRCEEAKVILRKKFLDEEFRSGYRPIDIVSIGMKPYTIFGMGIPERNEQIQKTFDDILCQVLDASDWLIKQWGLVEQDMSPFDENKPIRIEKGTLIPVPNVNGIKFPFFQNNIPQLTAILQILFTFFERWQGVNDQTLGRAGGARTATATIRLLGEAAQHFTIDHRRVAEGIKRMILNIWQLYRAYMPPEMTYRIMGTNGEYEFKSITREELIYHPDISLNLDIESVSKQYKQEAYRFLQQTIVNEFNVQAGIVTPANAYEISKLVLEAFDQKNIDLWITKPDTAGMLDPNDENIRILQQGEPLMPHQQDNDMMHLQTHMPVMQNPPAMVSMDRIMMLAMHCDKHQQQAQQKQQLAGAARGLQNNEEGGGGGGASPAQIEPQIAKPITAAYGRANQGMGDRTNVFAQTSGL